MSETGTVALLYLASLGDTWIVIVVVVVAEFFDNKTYESVKQSLLHFWAKCWQ